jgi:hypothetical protein
MQYNQNKNITGTSQNRSNSKEIKKPVPSVQNYGFMKNNLKPRVNPNDSK